MGMARMRIDAHVLRRALNLPSITQIHGSLERMEYGQIEIVVEHHDIPSTPSLLLPLVEPSFISQPQVVTLDKWNLQDPIMEVIERRDDV